MQTLEAMSTAELNTLKNAVAQELVQREKAQKAEGVERARALVAQYGLNVDDVFAVRKTARKERAPREPGAVKKVAPKFRDSATGATWSGRGKTPNWLKGKDKEQFRI